MKRVEGIPDFLYHYTDLKTLKLILMNKTLRFTSLKYMDDKTESLTGEGTDLGKFIFSSSWSEIEDSIPQWAMYGDFSRGVCIKMKSFPFKNNYDLYKLYTTNSEDLNDIDEPAEFYITHPKYFFESEFILSPLFTDDSKDIKERRENAKVLYTDDESKLLPNIISQSEGGLNIAFGKLGVYKHKQWEFQKEWRYKVIYAPIEVQEFLKNPDPNFSQKVVDKIFSNEHPTVKYIDYDIDEKYFDTLEVICGAMMDEFDFKDLTIFCRGINPNIKVSRSNLFNKWQNKNISV